MTVIGPDPGLAERFGVPVVELLEYPIDQEAATSVSAALCRRHKLLPIAREGRSLIVAMADPDDIVALDDVRAAAEQLVEADLGSEDAAFVVDQAEGHELQWYATQEIGALLELL